MKKSKDFDAVKMMRDIRDRMSEDMKDMTSEERIKYIRDRAEETKGQLKGRATAPNSR